MIGREQLERLWSSLLALGGRRLAAWGWSALAVFAAVGLGSYYLSRPQLEAIYTGLTPQDVSRIGAALREAGIHFDVNAQGTAVLVRYGQTAQARMLLAEKGLPSQRQRRLRAVRQDGLHGAHLLHAGDDPRARAGGRDRAHHPGHEGRQGRPRSSSCWPTPARSGADARPPRRR